MNNSKFKLSIVLPLCLLIYLAVLAYLGFDTFKAGKFLKYFGIIAGGLIVIVLLHVVLRKKEKMREKYRDSETQQYGTYNDNDDERKD